MFKVNRQGNWSLILDVSLFGVLIGVFLLATWTLVFGATFSWMTYFTINVVQPMGWIGLPAVVAMGSLILIRDKLAELTITTSGITTKIREVTKQQHEVKELGVVLLEGIVRISRNSERWSGWTPREISKLDNDVERLAATLELSNEELNKVWHARVRWELIDRSVDLFKRTCQVSQSGQKEKADLREEFDREWQLNDVVCPDRLCELLSKLYSAWDKDSVLWSLYERYKNEFEQSLFNGS